MSMDWPDERQLTDWNEHNAAADAELTEAELTGEYPGGGFEPARELTADELAQIEGGWPSMPEPEA